MMHEMYEMEENIDVLFLGSSHVQLSGVPSVLEEVMDERIFNGATGSQPYDTAYALLKEVGKNHTIDAVYLEMYYTIANQVPYENRNDLTVVYRVSDYMKFSLNKARFLFSASSQEYYVNSFFPMKRNWEGLIEVYETFDTIKKKQEEDYTNYTYQGEEYEYVEKGEWEITYEVEFEFLVEMELDRESVDNLTVEEQEVERRMIFLEDSNIFERPEECTKVVISALWNGEVVGSVSL